MVTEIMRGFYFPTKMIDADRESIVMKICNTIDVNIVIQWHVVTLFDTKKNYF